MNILITGGSSGLGKETVKLLASEGHKVWFTYNMQEESALALEQDYADVSKVKVNFCNPGEIVTLTQLIPSLDLDALINNAYVGRPQNTHFHKIESEEFLRSFHQNLVPTIEITQACLNVFRKKRFGKIINVITSYVLGHPPTGFSVYTANKAYLQSLSRVWVKEYTRFNITTNCVLPDFMNTGFGEVDERIVEQMVSSHPLKMLLKSKEVASVINYFINAPQQVNGVMMPINAGQAT